MAENLIKGASRRYRIDNGWLTQYASDPTRYIDLSEIQRDPANSQYIIDLNSPPLNRNVSPQQERLRASFFVNGFAIGDDSTVGDTVNGIYEEDDNAYIHRRSYVGGIEHPVRFRRIYANNTKARDIEFLGVSKRTSGYPGA